MAGWLLEQIPSKRSGPVLQVKRGNLLWATPLIQVFLGRGNYLVAHGSMGPEAKVAFSSK